MHYCYSVIHDNRLRKKRFIRNPDVADDCTKYTRGNDRKTHGGCFQ